MKHLILAAALALGACTGAPPQSASSVAVKADTVILTGQRAFAVAELGYITAAKGVGIVADTGVLPAKTANWLREQNAEARVLLIRGKATADSAEKARIAAKLFVITDALNTFVGSN